MHRCCAVPLGSRIVWLHDYVSRTYGHLDVLNLANATIAGNFSGPFCVSNIIKNGLTHNPVAKVVTCDND